MISYRGWSFGVIVGHKEQSRGFKYGSKRTDFCFRIIKYRCEVYLEVRRTESRKMIMMLLSCYSVDGKFELRQVDKKKADDIKKMTVISI